MIVADEYGDSEDVLGKWFAANPEKRAHVFLATKFGIRKIPQRDGLPREDAPLSSFRIDSSPEYCKQALEKSLRRLKLEYVDLFYVHRLDKVTPVENTVRLLAELKQQGKIRHIGLSECSAESLRRAHAVHPITAVQVEYSLFCKDIETRQLLATARELGVAVVAYSPLGNGILGGEIRAREDVTKPGDSRHILPWLKEENIDSNVKVVDAISKIAKDKGVTVGQLSLAWLLSQGDDIFPIPGTTKLHRLEENLASISITLTKEEAEELRALSSQVVGGRVQSLTGYDFADTPSL